MVESVTEATVKLATRPAALTAAEMSTSRGSTAVGDGLSHAPRAQRARVSPKAMVIREQRNARVASGETNELTSAKNCPLIGQNLEVCSVAMSPGRTCPSPGSD